MGELAVGIAHEIRNPLTIVKMIFESGGELTERDREVIGEEISRMNTIITHLLDYTRPKEAYREPCDINQSLEHSLLLLSHEFDKRHIRVGKNLTPGLPPVMADPVQLQQVFLNILLNATEAIDGKGKITIDSYPNGADVEVCIEDSGNGIPDRIQEQLFVPFTTTKRHGLGLGLSIVKRIIDAHQGTIDIRSVPEHGTTVVIRFPIIETLRENHEEVK